MNILVLCAYYPPELYSSRELDMELEEYLINQGHSIDVIVPFPSRGITTKEINKEKKEHTIIKYNGRVNVHRIKASNEKGGLARRFIRYTLTNFRQYYKAKELFQTKSFDVIYADATPPTQAIVCIQLAKKFSKPFVYRIGDLFPDNLVSMGILNRDSLVFKVIESIQRNVLKGSTRISVVSNNIKDILTNKGVSETKIDVIYDWVDSTKFYKVSKDKNSLYDIFGIKRESFVVTYAGNLGLAQGLEVIIQTAAILRDIDFVFIGSGAGEEDYKTLVKEMGLQNVFFFPMQPLEKVSEVYSFGDICLVTCKKGTGTNALPSKVWTIMSTGGTLIAAFDLGSELEKIINGNDCGLCVEPENPQVLSEAIMKIKNNPDQARRYGDNARRYLVNNKDAQLMMSKINMELIEAAKMSGGYIYAE